MKAKMNNKTPIEKSWKENNELKDLCIDFDGVIHSYKSGWKGITVIPDDPVSGAIEWLVNLPSNGYQPCIYSSRSKTWLGRKAMKKWFEIHLLNEIRTLVNLPDNEKFGSWRWKILSYWPGLDPWDIWVVEACHHFSHKILKYPSKKPPAYLTIDDRAIRFNGTFPTTEEMDNFEPWYKKTNQ